MNDKKRELEVLRKKFVTKRMKERLFSKHKKLVDLPEIPDTPWETEPPDWLTSEYFDWPYWILSGIYYNLFSHAIMKLPAISRPSLLVARSEKISSWETHDQEMKERPNWRLIYSLALIASDNTFFIEAGEDKVLLCCPDHEFYWLLHQIDPDETHIGISFDDIVEILLYHWQTRTAGWKIAAKTLYKILREKFDEERNEAEQAFNNAVAINEDLHIARDMSGVIALKDGGSYVIYPGKKFLDDKIIVKGEIHHLKFNVGRYCFEFTNLCAITFGKEKIEEYSEHLVGMESLVGIVKELFPATAILSNGILFVHADDITDYDNSGSLAEGLLEL